MEGSKLIKMRGPEEIQGLFLISKSNIPYGVPGTRVSQRNIAGLPIPEGALWGRAYRRHYDAVEPDSDLAKESLKKEAIYKELNPNFKTVNERFELCDVENKKDLYKDFYLTEKEDIVILEICENCKKEIIEEEDLEFDCEGVPLCSECMKSLIEESEKENDSNGDEDESGTSEDSEAKEQSNETSDESESKEADDEVIDEKVDQYTQKELESLKKGVIKDLLDDSEVEYDSTLLKAGLIKVCLDNNIKKKSE